MANSVHDQLVIDLAHDVVSRIAPEEIPLFQANSTVYFKDPNQSLSGRPGKDEVLGFVIAEAVTFLTPVALAVITEVIKFLTDEVRQSLKTESSILITETVKKLFRRFNPTDNKKDLRP